MTRLADYVFQRIAAEGVRHVFLLPGGGSMHLVDALGCNPDLTHVALLHEQACAVAADAYGQFANTLGVALVTTGPGGTNTITGLAAAWLESTACLFVSGQVKRQDLAVGRGVRQMGFQEIDIVSLVSPITKYAATVMDPQHIGYHLDKALTLARSGRPGPVWLDIPLDVQAAQIDTARLQRFDPADELRDREPADPSDLVASAIGLLNRARRPLVLVGNGVRLAGAVDAFFRMMELLNVPVLTTWKMLDLLADDHPLFAGRPGAIGQRGANFALQNADFILILGARLDFGQTGYNHRNFARAATKVMVDVDPAEIAKMDMAIDVSICADAGVVLNAFLRQKDRLAIQDIEDWRRRCRQWKQSYPVVLPEYWRHEGSVNPYVLVDALSDAMTATDLLVPGVSGACSEITMQAFRVTQGQRAFSSHGLGSMGFGIPASIGGCIASGGKRTVCVDGDGGFHMNIQELEVVRRLGLPIKYFVLNNEGYGSIRATQKSYFNGRYVASGTDSGLTLPDTVKVAGAYGIKTAVIRDHSRIREQVREILDADGPVVCDVIVAKDLATAPRIVSSQLPDGSFQSKPLEDLWPFLDREEFNANMLIPPLP